MFERTILVVGLLLAISIPCGAQAVKSSTPDTNSGPLTWISSDMNPKTVFWIQGRFVPVDDPQMGSKGAEVATIFCSVRENECLEMDSTIEFANEEQTWIEEFKPATWDKDGIMATGRSLDGCTDETLKVHFRPPSVVIVNSPVLPMSERCKSMNNAMDNLAGKHGLTLKGQLEQDMLVPTRGLLPFQDINRNATKAAGAKP